MTDDERTFKIMKIRMSWLWRIFHENESPLKEFTRIVNVLGILSTDENVSSDLRLFMFIFIERTTFGWHRLSKKKLSLLLIFWVNSLTKERWWYCESINFTPIRYTANALHHSILSSCLLYAVERCFKLKGTLKESEAHILWNF